MQHVEMALYWHGVNRVIVAGQQSPLHVRCYSSVNVVFTPRWNFVDSDLGLVTISLTVSSHS
jgi:hypothetical protein